MKAFTVESTKQFMSKFLGSEVFDDFLLEEASIKTFNTFTIDGRILPEFYDDYEFGYEFSTWQTLCPVCFDLIKGKQAPVACHFVLQLKPEKIVELLKENNSSIDPELIRSFTLNVKYLNGEVTLITATSTTTFVMDKTPDEIWDKYIEDFIKANA